MENKFIQSVMKMTGLLTALGFLLMSTYGSVINGVGLLLGAGWGCANLYFLKKLLQEILTLEIRKGLKIYAWTILKFPLLYLVGYGLLRIKFIPLVSLLGGFSLIFVALFFVGIAHQYQTKESKI